MASEVITVIRVGIVGYGIIGRVHSAALQELAECELIVVADVDPAARARAQRDFGVDVVASATEMLESYNVDLVDICVPTYLHEEIAIQAMEAGKHIFCEKPLTRNLEEAKRLLDRSSSYEKKIGIGHVVRFTPAYTGIRQSIEQGEIGQTGVVRTFRGGSEFPKGWQDWFADFDRSGGVILDLSIHDLDYCRWLFGDVERVYAQSTRGRTSARLEHAMIVLRFKNGVIAHIEGSWTNFPGQFHTRFEAAGTNGLISYDSRKTNPIQLMTVPESQAAVGRVAVNPYFLELQDMIQAIKEDRTPLVTLADAYATLELALAAVESARTGQVVEL